MLDIKAKLEELTQALSMDTGESDPDPVVDGLTTEEITDNRIRCRHVETSARICEACPGLSECPQNGLQYRPTRDARGELYFGMVDCHLKSADRHRRELDRNVESSRLSKKQLGMTFENYEVVPGNQRAVGIAKEIATGNRDKGLILHGVSGCGKSHLALAVLNEALKSGRAGLFTTFPELLEEIKLSFNTEKQGRLLRSVKNAPILVLDDIGAEKCSEWVTERLFIILNHRLNHDLLTIITTNKTPNELGARLSEGDLVAGIRIMSRLEELVEWVTISDRDRRR